MLKPHRVDAFGEAENLENAVRRALSGEEQNLPSKFKIREGSIEISDRTTKFPPHLDIEHYSVFEDLFNPKDGYLRDLDGEVDFSVCKYVRIPKVWDSEVEKREIGYVESDQISEIQRRSIEESFTPGYSAEKFRELYEYVIK
ncbi:MAG: hypothetical protein BRC27_00535 [Nanohaloarchaea archaeon SW_10_44_10]|nr:MAG: hypothetical protein BRC27_00535 [Nanohaloarchaea archaeon SW_10_44_10]